MHKLLVVAIVVSGCGAQIQREVVDDAAAAEVGASPVAPPIVDSGHDTRPVETAPPDPSFGCSVEKAPRTCWKCCENVPGLYEAMLTYHRSVLPCFCTHPACAVGCEKTCSVLDMIPTPWAECSPCLQAHASECLEGVKPEERKALDVFLACTATCPTTF